MPHFYQPDLTANIDSPFVRDGDNKLIRRSYWLDMDDRTLVMIMTKGIGAKRLSFQCPLSERLCCKTLEWVASAAPRALPRFGATTEQSAANRCIGTFRLAVGAACAFSLRITV
jgi:hypothetical protein